MRFIWVRHGQTEANAEKRYIGHSDPPLNETGRIEARQLASFFRDHPITHIYTSDLLRASETASCIGAAHSLKPILTPALRELHFGVWEGKTYEEIMRKDAVRFNAWIASPFDVSPPEGENFLQLGERLDRWLHREVMGLSRAGLYLIVSHGGPYRWFYHSHISPNTPLWEVQIPDHGEAISFDILP